MRASSKIVGVLGIAAAAALSGCAASGEELTEAESVNTALAAEDATGESASAQYACQPGSRYVYHAGMCITTPYRLDPTPGAYQCANGAVVSGLGNVVCLLFPVTPPPPAYYPPPPAYPPPAYMAPIYQPPPRRP